jgi:hypothetical protein
VLCSKKIPVKLVGWLSNCQLLKECAQEGDSRGINTNELLSFSVRAVFVELLAIGIS